MQSKILFLGAIYLDIATKLPKIPVVNDVIYCDEFKANLGGKASNAAVACSRLGQDSYILGSVGEDFIGEEMLKTLKSENVDVSLVAKKQGVGTGSTVVEVDQEGKNVIIVNKGANYALSKSDVDNAFRDHDSGKTKFDMFYTSLEPKEEITSYAITNSFDRGIPVFCDSAPRPTKTIVGLLPKIEFVAPNQKEAELITGVKVNDIESAFSACQKIRGMGGNTVVVSMSSFGAVVLEKGKDNPEHVVAIKIKTVDETAAGDAFRAAFCVNYLKTGNVFDSVVFANKSGALAASKFGAYNSMPTLSEIENMHF